MSNCPFHMTTIRFDAYAVFVYFSLKSLLTSSGFPLRIPNTRRLSTNGQLLQEEFGQHGFAVLPNVISTWEQNLIRRRVLDSLVSRQCPVEYEADVGYPGAPKSRDASGGSTPRRLLAALDRDSVFLSLALNPKVINAIQKLLGHREVAVSQAHHNCIMTKFPAFSSDTLWHRDFRFWAFDKPTLITAWFALDDESAENGSLSVIPGSHKLRLARDQFDEQSFFCRGDKRNTPLVDSAINLRLRPGDVLLFHCQLLHSATRNFSGELKISPVFTYHSERNNPIPGTRSSSLPSIRISRSKLAG